MLQGRIGFQPVRLCVFCSARTSLAVEVTIRLRASLVGRTDSQEYPHGNNRVGEIG